MYKRQVQQEEQPNRPAQAENADFKEWMKAMFEQTNKNMNKNIESLKEDFNEKLNKNNESLESMNKKMEDSWRRWKNRWTRILNY